MKIFYVPHGLHEHSFDDVKHVHPRWQWAMENKLFWKGRVGRRLLWDFRAAGG